MDKIRGRCPRPHVFVLICPVALCLTQIGAGRDSFEKSFIELAICGLVIYLSIRFNFWQTLLLIPIYIVYEVFQDSAVAERLGEKLVKFFGLEAYYSDDDDTELLREKCSEDDHDWVLAENMFVDTIRDEGPGQGRLIGEVRYNIYLCMNCGEEKSEEVEIMY
jgi:hypothetical protein